MLNVNGIEVKLVNKVPRKVANGWLHETTVYVVDRPSLVATLIGSVTEVTSNKHGGRSVDKWAEFKTFDNGRMLRNGSLNDLVNRYAEERRYLSDPQAQVRDTRYYS